MTIPRLGSLLIVALAVAGPAAGQTIPYGGTEVFRFALHRQKFTPATDFETVRRGPTQSLIVVFGNTDGLTHLMSGTQLRSFLVNGGAVLIVTDQSNESPAFRGSTWGSEFRIKISGEHLSNHPALCYKGITTKPNVEPVLLREPDRLLSGIFRDLPGPVATDRPSEMTYNRNLNGLIVTELAKYPRGTMRSSDGHAPRPEANNFAIAVKPIPGWPINPAGRMLVVADQSVFANGMFGFQKDPDQPEGFSFDNGNWVFLNRTINWLQAGPPGPRTQCLFIENGTIVPRFAVEVPPGGPQPGMPNLPPEFIANWLLNAADPILNEYQDRGVFDKFFERRPAFAARAARTLLIALTIVFAFIALRRLIRGYRKPAATPLPTAVSEGMLPRGGVVRQRTDAQLEIGNLYEAARRRVRDRFDRLGGAPGANGQMPPVLVANDIRDGELLRSAVAWLWPIGYGDTPVPVPPTEWDRVNALLERLTRRAAAGDWSFGVEV